MSDERPTDDGAKDSDGNDAQSNRLAMGIGVGMAIGVAIGVAMNNIGLGIGIGLAFGAAFGAIPIARRGTKD